MSSVSRLRLRVKDVSFHQGDKTTDAWSHADYANVTFDLEGHSISPAGSIVELETKVQFDASATSRPSAEQAICRGLETMEEAFRGAAQHASNLRQHSHPSPQG